MSSPANPLATRGLDGSERPPCARVRVCLCVRVSLPAVLLPFWSCGETAALVSKGRRVAAAASWAARKRALCSVRPPPLTLWPSCARDSGRPPCAAGFHLRKAACVRRLARNLLTPPTLVPAAQVLHAGATGRADDARDPLPDAAREDAPAGAEEGALTVAGGGSAWPVWPVCLAGCCCVRVCARVGACVRG